MFVYNEGHHRIQLSNVSSKDDLYIKVNFLHKLPFRCFDSKAYFLCLGYIHGYSIEGNILKVEHGACSDEYYGTQIYRVFMSHFLNELIEHYNKTSKVKIQIIRLSKFCYRVTPAIKLKQQQSILSYALDSYGEGKFIQKSDNWFVEFNWKKLSKDALSQLYNRCEDKKIRKPNI